MNTQRPFSNLTSPIPLRAVLLVLSLAACGTDPATGVVGEPADSTVTSFIPTTSSEAPREGQDPTTTAVGPDSITTTLPPALSPAEDRDMSVAEALKTNLDGPATVVGFLMVVDGQSLLAEALLESFPPQPGGATISVIGVDIGAYETQTERSVTWTNATVEIVGVLDSGVLYVDGEDL